MKVAIVEDDAATRMYMEETVKSQGFDWRSAADGVAGLDLIRDYEPDLVFLDVQMPGMDGLDVLRAIRDEGLDAIVVVNTAFGTEDYAITALRLRANDYLKKPVRHAAIIPMLHKYASVVAARRAPTALPEFVETRQCRVVTDNRLDRIALLADYLTTESEMRRSHQLALGITLGLVELLSNAIEHGNLGITGEEKTAALESAPDGYRRLLNERLSDPVLSARRVSVDLTSTHRCAEWRITDEGHGFDWEEVMSALETPDPLALHGRGLFLATCYFDHLAFEGNGNAVRVRKNKTALV